MSTAKKPSRPLREAEYTALAEFRYQVRKFQRHMQEQVRRLGVNPQQYQLVLAVKGLPEGQSPTIGALAERMQLNHNSTVELVDRCERRGLLRRDRAGQDRRQVILSITGRGENLLRKLGSTARGELLGSGPSLVDAVQQLTLGSTNNHRGRASKKS
ncbi:MAG TPA: MarR family transcriptional regulator [Candidatus Angelobacter sp.]|nr:MarR family transcriptional regulator [Candidatus Angelobacter sp.]